MTGLERLWAGWRSPYLSEVPAEGDDEACVFCRILASDDEAAAQVVWRDEFCAVVLNAYPYTSGHLLVMPVRHVADIDDLDIEHEAPSLWGALGCSVRAIRSAYNPDGLNLGANLGRSAGAGVPGHFHLHVVPRWNGDTNFMTTVAETRVLPEALPQTLDKVRSAWPQP
ncbi:MAG TPA: HIT domain-containing protein [Acidimicrobiales bacterium]